MIVSLVSKVQYKSAAALAVIFSPRSLEEPSVYSFTIFADTLILQFECKGECAARPLEKSRLAVLFVLCYANSAALRRYF
jgi:hypothetical protein